MQLLFAVGLLLTLAAGTQWARAQWVTDSFLLSREWVEPGDVVAVEVITLDCGRSSFVLSRQTFRTIPALRHEPTDRNRAPWRLSHHTRELAPQQSVTRPREWWERLGFVRASGFGVEAFRVPSWFIVLFAAAPMAPAAIWFRQHRQSWVRRRRGLCVDCGYDLRGAAHERCPECGAGVEAVSRGDRGLPPAAISSRADRGGCASS
jgi:hypothetical protein